MAITYRMNFCWRVFHSFKFSDNPPNGNGAEYEKIMDSLSITQRDTDDIREETMESSIVSYATPYHQVFR